MHGEIVSAFPAHEVYEEAIAIWTEGDGLIEELQKLGEEMHREISSGPTDPAEYRPRASS